ncbi:ribosome maturation factor RimM [Maribellus mangrovi]|uniref:ribosome maturation factor RimM n=1 Tax=Maribellus mangrovi TaxID=3133146 RepID=UPI0030EEAD09
METIPKSDCEKIGFFRKTHGVHGEVVLEYEEHYEYSVEEAERFFVELDGLLVPFFIQDEGLRFRSAKSVIVNFEEVKTEAYAKRLIGQSAWLYKTEIVDEPEEHTATLLGYTLIDEQRGVIGPIEEMDDFAGNIVFNVNFRGQELLVPYNEEMLVELDEGRKEITLKLPDGLIEG